MKNPILQNSLLTIYRNRQNLKTLKWCDKFDTKSTIRNK